MAHIERLEAIIERQNERLAAQEQHLAELEAKLAKALRNSSNSSKPPSSDITAPPRPPGSKPGRRRIGAQPGHEGHVRPPFPPERIDRVVDYRLGACPRCGGALERQAAPVRLVQQAELVAQPIAVTEHRAWGYFCAHCQRAYAAQVPRALRAAGLVGLRLRAMLAWLKSSAHVSYTALADFASEGLGLPLSRGYLAKVLAHTSAALQGPYEELQAALPSAARLHVDETGHKERGKRLWTWVFRAPAFTLFHISPSRGAKVLVKVLGKVFQGILSCDYFSAYRKYIGKRWAFVQFCLAHFIREVKFFADSTDRVTAGYGARLLTALRALFRLFHRRERLTPVEFQRRLHTARETVLTIGKRAPDREGPRQLAARLRRHGNAYFTFVTTPGVEPTNNLAEQALRFVVIDRRLTQGTRSPSGRRVCERLWSARATCRQQGRSFWAYLRDAVTAVVHGQPAPSLLPQGP